MNEGRRMLTLSEEHVRWLGLRRSGLDQPFDSPAQAAGALAGVQAQRLPAAGPALWNRTPNLTHARLDQLLHDERCLVKPWGQRGTLLVHGRLAGTWRDDRRGRGLDITVRPFGQLNRARRAVIVRQARGVAAYFELPLVAVAVA
jgi:hypothetical protein